MSAPERIWAWKKLTGEILGSESKPEHAWQAEHQWVRADIHRAELAQVHDLYASLARKGATTDFIRETGERGAEALRGEGR